MAMEQRDCIILLKIKSQLSKRQEEQMKDSKPYEISKKVVMTAYRRVKSNRGSAGIDGQDIEEFEKDLKRNLYKIWNRMS